MTKESELDNYREKLAGSIRSLKAHLSKYRNFTEKIQDDPRKAAEYVERLQSLTEEQEDLIQRVGEDVFAWIQAGGDLELVEEEGDTPQPGNTRDSASDSQPDPQQARPQPPRQSERTRRRDRWSKDGRTTRSEQAQSASSDETPDRQEASRKFQEVLDDLGAPPEELAELPEVSEEVAALQEAVDTRDVWPGMPDEKQRQLIGYIVSRARRVQDEVSGALKFESAEEKLGDVFRILTKYSKIEKPGFVHGLARSHEPQTGKWLDDAERIWNEFSDE